MVYEGIAFLIESVYRGMEKMMLEQTCKITLLEYREKRYLRTFVIVRMIKLLFRNNQARAFRFKLLQEASIYITVGNNVPNFIE